MELVKTLPQARSRNGYGELYSFIEQMEEGQIVKFDHGDDFKTKPGNFAQALKHHLSSKEWDCQVITRGGSVYVHVIDKYEDA